MINSKKYKSLLIFIILSLTFSLGILTVSNIKTLHASPVGWVWQNPLPQGNYLRSIWGSGPNDIFAVGDYGTILHYYNGDEGFKWYSMNSGTSNDLYSIWGSGPNNIFAVGYAGTIIHYDGNTWSSMYDDSIHYHLYSIWGSGPNDVFAVGFPGKSILHYDGTNWSSISISTTNPFLYSIWGSGPNDIFAV